MAGSLIVNKSGSSRKRTPDFRYPTLNDAAEAARTCFTQIHSLYGWNITRQRGSDLVTASDAVFGCLSPLGNVEFIGVCSPSSTSYFSHFYYSHFARLRALRARTPK
jgi:hypothetical protein